MRRLRGIDFRLSRGPQAVGIVQEDANSCYRILNAAQERLLYDKAQSDEGWQGSFAEMVFSVDPKLPYITCPRGVARLEAIDVCGKPVPLYNQFYEYLQFGNGRMPKENRWRALTARGFAPAGFSRNNAVLFQDLMDAPQQIQVQAVNPQDYVPNNNTGLPKRVLVQGLDQNGYTVWTQDGISQQPVEGEFVTLQAPFGITVNQFSQITGIQKDPTVGPVLIFQSDPYWGSLELLSHMEPTETTASYRRYYLNGLPCGCCRHDRMWKASSLPGCPCRAREFVLVTAIAKLDLVPVVGDTDYCVIQNLEALIAECQSVRYSEMDSPQAMQKSAERHQAAIRLLIGELSHYQGKNSPSIDFAPFGSARLERVCINMI